MVQHVPNLPVSSLFLIFMGSLDCLTTVVGTLFFGAQELNPLIAGLVNSDIVAFVVVKLAVTAGVALIFIVAEKTLMQSEDKKSRSFKIAYNSLKTAYFGIILFLAVVVLNNLFVLLRLVP